MVWLFAVVRKCKRSDRSYLIVLEQSGSYLSSQIKTLPVCNLQTDFWRELTFPRSLNEFLAYKDKGQYKLLLSCICCFECEKEISPLREIILLTVGIGSYQVHLLKSIWIVISTTQKASAGRVILLQCCILLNFYLEHWCV